MTPDRVSHMVLAIFHRNIDELSILRFLRGGEDERRVGGSILGLVFVDCCDGLSTLRFRRDERLTWNEIFG